MIVEERMRTYINSLDMGNTPFLEELEKEARKDFIDYLFYEVSPQFHIEILKATI